MKIKTRGKIVKIPEKYLNVFANEYIDEDYPCTLKEYVRYKEEVEEFVEQNIDLDDMELIEW